MARPKEGKKKGEKISYILGEGVYHHISGVESRIYMNFQRYFKLYDTVNTDLVFVTVDVFMKLF